MTRVRQLRLVVHAEDYDAALAFFRDTLGMPTSEAYAGDGGAEVTILDAGQATLELANTPQIEMIDEVEVGRRLPRTSGSPWRWTTRWPRTLPPPQAAQLR